MDPDILDKSAPERLLTLLKRDSGHYKSRQSLIICDLAFGFLEMGKLVLVDAGADAFNDGRMSWVRVGKERISLHAFDADLEASTRRNAEAKQHGWDHHYYPYAVAEKRKLLHVYLAKTPGSSSSFKPQPHLYSFWRYDGAKDASEIFAVDKEIDLEAMPLDEWRIERQLPKPDFLKMNIQGSELAALAGFQDGITDVVGVELEMAMAPYYEGSPHFSDIDPVLRRAGFTFFDLLAPNVIGYKDSPIYVTPERDFRTHSWPRKQFFEGHFLYLRNPLADSPGCGNLTWQKWLKLACCAEAYGQLEFAFAVLSWIASTYPKQRNVITAVRRAASALYTAVFNSR